MDLRKYKRYFYLLVFHPCIFIPCYVGFKNNNPMGVLNYMRTTHALVKLQTKKWIKQYQTLYQYDYFIQHIKQSESFTFFQFLLNPI